MYITKLIVTKITMKMRGVLVRDKNRRRNDFDWNFGFVKGKKKKL